MYRVPFFDNKYVEFEWKQIYKYLCVCISLQLVIVSADNPSHFWIFGENEIDLRIQVSNILDVQSVWQHKITGVNIFKPDLCPKFFIS